MIAVKGETKLGRSGAPEVCKAVRQLRKCLESAKSESEGRASDEAGFVKPRQSTSAPPVGRRNGQRGQYVSSHRPDYDRSGARQMGECRRLNSHQCWWGRERRKCLYITLWAYGGIEIKGSRLWPKRTFGPK